MKEISHIPVGSLVRMSPLYARSIYQTQVGIVMAYDHFGILNAKGVGNPVVLWPRNGKQRMGGKSLVIVSLPEVKE